jgi:DNA-binding NtrC family response regulator
MLQEEERTLPAKHYAPLILIVEDDEDHRALYRQAFRLLTPYYVQVVRNGSQALHFVTQIKPNVFILDYRLPDMNGLDLYDQLHAIPGLERIPAIIISGVSSEEASHAIESRHLLRVEKPFDLDAFFITIKQALAQLTSGQSEVTIES